MFSQQKTDSVTRSVSSRTLDGRKLTAEVSILLNRAMGRSDAEALATQVAGIVDDILAAQIIQGQAPLTANDLEQLTLAKAKGLGKIARVRISSLRLSVPAGAPVPSVRPPAVKPLVGSISPTSQSGTRLGVTGEPARETNPLPRRSPTPLPSTRLTPPRSTSPLPGTSLRPPAAPAAGSSRPPTAPTAGSSRPPTSMTTQASQPPIPATIPSRPSTATTSSRAPAPAATMPSPPPDPSRAPGAPTTMRAAPHGMPAHTPVPPPSTPPSMDAFGAAVAQPLRDTAARAVIAVLSVVTSANVDRLSLLEGNAPAPELCREVCACFAASIYRTAIARGEPHKVAAAKVEIVCKHAFSEATSPSATEIGFYIAMDAPTVELASRIATYLGCANDVHLLRAALTSCHAAFGERLVFLQERLS
ncbi:MAG TPA: hypothetical protein VH062_17200 [Polyangiaceae bacterium]|jgi:hypothetical protein|nr:hypothetical protein [Polyangiaceae bacterium]